MTLMVNINQIIPHKQRKHDKLLVFHIRIDKGIRGNYIRRFLEEVRQMLIVLSFHH